MSNKQNLSLQNPDNLNNISNSFSSTNETPDSSTNETPDSSTNETPDSSHYIIVKNEKKIYKRKRSLDVPQWTPFSMDRNSESLTIDDLHIYHNSSKPQSRKFYIPNKSIETKNTHILLQCWKYFFK